MSASVLALLEGLAVEVAGSFVGFVLLCFRIVSEKISTISGIDASIYDFVIGFCLWLVPFFKVITTSTVEVPLISSTTSQTFQQTVHTNALYEGEDYVEVHSNPTYDDQAAAPAPDTCSNHPQVMPPESMNDSEQPPSQDPPEQQIQPDAPDLPPSSLSSTADQAQLIPAIPPLGATGMPPMQSPPFGATGILPMQSPPCASYCQHPAPAAGTPSADLPCSPPPPPPAVSCLPAGSHITSPSTCTCGRDITAPCTGGLVPTARVSEASSVEVPPTPEGQLSPRLHLSPTRPGSEAGAAEGSTPHLLTLSPKPDGSHLHILNPKLSPGTGPTTITTAAAAAARHLRLHGMSPRHASAPGTPLHQGAAYLVGSPQTLALQTLMPQTLVSQTLMHQGAASPVGSPQTLVSQTLVAARRRLLAREGPVSRSCHLPHSRPAGAAAAPSSKEAMARRGRSRLQLIYSEEFPFATATASSRAKSSTCAAAQVQVQVQRSTLLPPAAAEPARRGRGLARLSGAGCDEGGRGSCCQRG